MSDMLQLVAQRDFNSTWKSTWRIIAMNL